MRWPARTEIDIPSPAEFNKLGVWELRKLAELTALARGDFLVFAVYESPFDVRFLLDVVEFIEAEVEGRDDALGGCGNEPILTVFRTGFDGMPDGFSLALERSGVEWVG